jgi:hypothetical protein
MSEAMTARELRLVRLLRRAAAMLYHDGDARELRGEIYAAIGSDEGVEELSAAESTEARS